MSTVSSEWEGPRGILEGGIFYALSGGQDETVLHVVASPPAQLNRDGRPSTPSNSIILLEMAYMHPRFDGFHDLLSLETLSTDKFLFMSIYFRVTSFQNDGARHLPAQSLSYPPRPGAHHSAHPSTEAE
jgi:hypothetical protein